MDNKIIILIPAYEPTLSMIELLKELKKQGLKVIVVNDGSNSEYDEVFTKASKYAKVLTHDVNKGKGAALKTGMNYIQETEKKDYIIVTMDCDGQHSIKDALKLGEYIKKHPNQLVLGKRIRSQKTPLRSRVGNAITRFIYRVTTGLDVYDTQTGLRAFSKKLVPYMLKVDGDRFEYEMNVLLKCSMDKIKMKELEIETIYIDNNSHSHFRTIQDSILVYKEIVKFLMSSICGFVVDYIVYSILVSFTNKLTLSNVIARVISATLNYNINKKLVFKNKNKDYKQILEYSILAFIILVLNTIVLNIFVSQLSINKYLAKILTELILLTLSWIVQKKIIFKKNK